MVLTNFSFSRVINSLHHTLFGSRSKTKPPGVVENFSYNLTSNELLMETETFINDCQQLFDKVASVEDSDVSFETVLKVLNEAEAMLSTRGLFLQFGKSVSPDSNIRNASSEAALKINSCFERASLRKDIFHKLLVLEKKEDDLTPLAKRHLEQLIRTGKRNGLLLDEETQKKIKQLVPELNNLLVDLYDDLAKVTTTLQFSKEELNGVPENFFKELTEIPDSGKYEVIVKYPHYINIAKNCNVPETRKRLEFAVNTQCVATKDRVTEIRKLEHEIDTLLGYPNHAAFKTETLMSKNPENVNKFLNELAENMTPLWNEEKKYLLELKEKECAELGIPFDGKLNDWDTRYYHSKAKIIKYAAVDKDKLSEYFPLPVFKDGLLKIYQNLLGLKFQLVQGDVWHEDVEMYSVTDSESGNLLGYFYLDLYTRPNKAKKGTCYSLQRPFRLSDGTRQVAVAAMVMNFLNPTDDIPILLDFNEVVYTFQKFATIMHYICIDVEYVHYSSFQMEDDFIIPITQIFENWCWEKEALREMSSHYIDKSEIPEDVLNALVQSRFPIAGYFYMRHIILALYDQRIFSSPQEDSKEIYYELMRKFIGIEPQEGTLYPCALDHLVKEYDADYHCYLSSFVYSMDMYQTRFGAENVLNPVVGKEYREKIFAPGGSQDCYDMICNFLGREPTQEAFLRSRGVKV